MIGQFRIHDDALSFVAQKRNMICSATLCNDAGMAEDETQAMEPHERLAWARRRAGYETAIDFAKAIGIHPTTYRAYENGQNGFSKLAPTIAKRAGVTIEWLMGESQTPARLLAGPPPRQQPDYPRVVDISDHDDVLSIRSVDLSYAMGDGTNLEDYFEETAVRFDPSFIRSVTRAPAEALFVAKGDGDSMFPTMINDDQVLIDTSQRTLNQQDRIWACSIHGAGMIKRLRVIGEGRVEVRSDNPAIGSREVAAEELRIVGRVIWIGRRV